MISFLKKHHAAWRMHRERLRKHALLSFVIDILVVLPFAFAIRTIFFGLYQVPSGSMETTMLVGERFFATKSFDLWLRPLKHGDVIAFNQPEATGYTYSKNPFMRWWQQYVYGPQNWTKRIIGMPGDHIEGKIEDGKPVVYRNGEKLDEPYLNTYPLLYVATSKEIPSMHDLIILGISKQPYTRQYISLEDQQNAYRSVQNFLSSLHPRSYDPSVSFAEQPFYKMDPAAIVSPASNNPVILELTSALDPAAYKIREPQTPLDNYPGYGSDIYDIHLGPNDYWVMGDNRLGSKDSRDWGILDGSLIHARIVYRFWSFDSEESWWIVDLIKHPLDFWKKVRWNRCFQFVQ